MAVALPIVDNMEMKVDLAKKLGEKVSSIDLTPINGSGRLLVRFSVESRKKFPCLCPSREGTPEEIMGYLDEALSKVRCEKHCEKASKLIAQKLGVQVGLINVKSVREGEVTVRFEKTVMRKHRDLPRKFVGTIEELFEILRIDQGQLKRVYA